MSLLAQIDSDIKDAMRARGAERLGVLRMLKSTLKATAMEKGIADEAIDDATALSVLRKEMKKRQDSIESFEKGGRMDLADKEKSEAEILAAYLPKALTAEEVEALVKAAIAEAGATSKAQMGAVMKLATERAAGRADGRALSAAVGRLLP
ncbi:MAG: GatB/YqeY domain-containing protein [Chthoniobacteraceae bacterium]